MISIGREAFANIKKFAFLLFLVFANFLVLYAIIFVAIAQNDEY